MQAADARLNSATSALDESQDREGKLQAQLEAAVQNLEVRACSHIMHMHILDLAAWQQSHGHANFSATAMPFLSSASTSQESRTHNIKHAHIDFRGMQCSQALDQERSSMQEDLHRLTEDLESLTRENQVISNSLETAREEGTRWQAQARAGGARMSHLEMVLGGREAEIAELRSTCEVAALSLQFQAYAFCGSGLQLACCKTARKGGSSADRIELKQGNTRDMFAC